MSKPTFSAIEISCYKVLDPKDIQVADKNILQDWTCGICQELVFNPMICDNCNYICCKDCIEENMKKCKYICPIKCKSPAYRILNVTENKYINNIKLRCKHEGCNEFIEYTNYNDHLEHCQKRLYQCNNHPCKSQGIYKQMVEHSKICQYRTVYCKLCKKPFTYIDKDKHFSMDCSEALVKCHFCGKKIKRKEYIETHQSNDAKCLKNLVETMNKTLNEYENEIKRLETENYNLRKEIQDSKNLIKKKNKEITELTK